MKNSVKAALLSGLIFPGLGQLKLKHRARGMALMFIVLASLLVIVIRSVQQALAVLENIELADGEIDIGSILNSVTQAPTTFDSLIFHLASSLIILCWVIGVIDAYRLGKRKDLEEQKSQGTNVSAS